MGSRRGGGQAVTDAPYGLDGNAGGCAERVAQAADGAVDDALPALEPMTPHVPQQRIPAERTPAVTG